jgi:hypothetical protein
MLGIDDNIHIRLAGAASAHMSRGILFIVGDGLHHAPGRDPSSFSYSLNLSPPHKMHACAMKLICGGVMGVSRDDDGRHKNKNKTRKFRQFLWVFLYMLQFPIQNAYQTLLRYFFEI